MLLHSIIVIRNEHARSSIFHFCFYFLVCLRLYYFLWYACQCFFSRFGCKIFFFFLPNYYIQLFGVVSILYKCLNFFYSINSDVNFTERLINIFRKTSLVVCQSQRWRAFENEAYAPLTIASLCWTDSFRFLCAVSYSIPTSAVLTSYKRWWQVSTKRCLLNNCWK